MAEAAKSAKTETKKSSAKSGAKGAGKGRKKAERKNVAEAVVHVFSSFNNTIITITDKQGNALASCSAGAMGFKGSRKSTPYAAQVTTEEAGKKAQEHGVRDVDVLIKGPGSGRESALRALSAVGFTVKNIKDITAVPHNGVKMRKRRRI
jgi:small subunit ribosomal protein S11